MAAISGSNEYMNDKSRNKEHEEEMARARKVSRLVKKAYSSFSEAEQNEKSNRLMQSLNEALDQLPSDDVLTLSRHWEGKTVPTLEGQFEQAPVFVIDQWFTTFDGGLPATASVNQAGTRFQFDLKLMFAPKAVLNAVFYHELAHALRRANGCLESDPPKGNISSTIKETYPESAWNEEQSVSEILKRWNIEEDLLAIWEVALEEVGLDCEPLYEKLLLKSRACLT